VFREEDQNARFPAIMRHISARGRPIGAFAMIAGYLDESTTPDNAVLSVAITVADLDGWGGLGRVWLPQIAGLESGYHAKDCKALHMALAKAMEAHTAFSSFITITQADYHEHLPKWTQSILGGPYSFGVLFSLMSAAKWSRENGAGRMFYFIEQGHRGFAQASMMMTAMMRSEELRDMFALEGWGPATKADIPVHCPDTVSYNATAYFGSQTKSRFLDVLYNCGKLSRGNFTEQAFREHAGKFKDAARATLRRGRRYDLARHRPCRLRCAAVPVCRRGRVARLKNIPISC